MKYKISTNDYLHGGTDRDYYGESEVECCLCPLCSSQNHIKIYKERGHIGIVDCMECGLTYTNPRAINAETNYFGDETLFYNEARLIFDGQKTHHRDKNYEFELREMQKIKAHGKLLDIGTNMGFFLNKARQFGFDVCGVEPSTSLAKIATDKFHLRIANSFFNKSLFDNEKFDIVTMIDVFEHVTEPLGILSDIHQIMKNDGLLCIKVPNGNYNKLKLKLARAFKREDFHDIFNGYEHVVHYTSETMKKMLDKQGFKIKKTILPLPIHPPLWANLVGHYYQYPSPFILDWKRRITRELFYIIGKMEKTFGMKIEFAPDLMFMIEKK